MVDEGNTDRRGAAAVARQTRSHSGLDLVDEELQNDLEAAVATRQSAIGRLVATARPGAGYVAMSGSGSAVFGLFDGRAPRPRHRARRGRWAS
jgi:4-diphosphocytidyl-2C-methyl-D-erythritol kinase